MDFGSVWGGQENYEIKYSFSMQNSIQIHLTTKLGVNTVVLSVTSGKERRQWISILIGMK